MLFSCWFFLYLCSMKDELRKIGKMMMWIIGALLALFIGWFLIAFLGQALINLFL